MQVRCWRETTSAINCTTSSCLFVAVLAYRGVMAAPLSKVWFSSVLDGPWSISRSDMLTSSRWHEQSRPASPSLLVCLLQNMAPLPTTCTRRRRRHCRRRQATALQCGCALHGIVTTVVRFHHYRNRWSLDSPTSYTEADVDDSKGMLSARCCDIGTARILQHYAQHNIRLAIGAAGAAAGLDGTLQDGVLVGRNNAQSVPVEVPLKENPTCRSGQELLLKVVSLDNLKVGQPVLRVGSDGTLQDGVIVGVERGGQELLVAIARRGRLAGGGGGAKGAFTAYRCAIVINACFWFYLLVYQSKTLQLSL